jgi:hypothetical protein
MKSRLDSIVDAYMAELDAALTAIPVAARRDIIEEVREHIDNSIADGVEMTDTDLRNVLAGIGSPLAVARAAASEFPPVPSPRPPRPWRDWIAVFLTPFVWPVGIVLVWASTIWTRREKLLATIAFPGGIYLSLFMAGFVYAGRTCEGHLSDNGTAVLDSCVPSDPELIARLGIQALLVAVPIVVAVYLALRLVQRTGRRHEPEPDALD